jgi:hypothetical protein
MERRAQPYAAGRRGLSTVLQMRTMDLAGNLPAKRSTQNRTFASVRKCRLDAPVHPITITIQAPGVDPEQDVDRVAGACGDLGGSNTSA